MKKTTTTTVEASKRGSKPRAKNARKKEVVKVVVKSAQKQPNSNRLGPNRPKWDDRIIMPRHQLSIAPPNESAMVEAYVACMLKPSVTMCRIPDSETRESCLVRSVQEYQISAFFDTTVNSGRFSIATKPVLGNLSSVLKYKTSMVQLSSAWSGADWTSPSSYANLANGQDPRIDLNEPLLTQPSNFFLLLTGGGSLSPGIPLGSAPVPSIENYGLNIMYDPTTGNFTLPLGTFYITFEYKGSADVVAPTIVQVTGFAVFTILNISSDNSLQSNAWSVQVTTAGIFNISGVNSDNITSSYMSITPAFFANEAASQTGGMTKLIRPVAQSMLFTATIPELQAGGNVSGAFVPASSCSTNFFSNNGNMGANIGQFQNWEQLGQVSGSYQGIYQRGCYVWWAPETVSDRDYRVPGTGPDYPCLVISGAVQTIGAATPTGSVPIGRIVLTTVYELYCNTTLLEARTCYGSDAIIDCSKRIVAMNPHAMGNADHVPWFKRTMANIWSAAKGVGQFAYENRDAIGALVKSGAAMI